MSSLCLASVFTVWCFSLIFIQLQVRNVAPRTKDEQGQQKRQESPIHHSNVMHYSMSAGKRSRVGYKVTEDGRKVSSG
jgi:large subunit ribosomal protein L24